MLFYFIIDYILNESSDVYNNETMSYGLWLLKFVKIDKYYEIYELDEHFKEWQEGVIMPFIDIEQQKVVCKDESAEFMVPSFTQKIAISDGVLEGLRVQGIA